MSFDINNIVIRQSLFTTSLTFVQPNQINMALMLLYPVKSDAGVRYCTLAYSGQGTRTTWPTYITGHPNIYNLPLPHPFFVHVGLGSPPYFKLSKVGFLGFKM